ncbi:MAG: hypothetical protein AB7S48_00925 [Bacteroidales bacterium]
MKKIKLDKKVVAVLTTEEKAQVVGGNQSQAALDPDGNGIIWICNTSGCNLTVSCDPTTSACISVDARTNQYICD